MDTSPVILAPTASLANKGRLESLLSRLGSESEPLGALQMLSATAATTAAPNAPSSRKRPSESIDREGSSSEAGAAGLNSDSLMPKDETALVRAKKMQEKNKRAQEKMEGLDDKVRNLGTAVAELTNLNEELSSQKLALQQALDQQRCGHCGGPLTSQASAGTETQHSKVLLPPTTSQPNTKQQAKPFAEITNAIIKGEPSFELFIPHILKVSAGRQLSSEQLAQPNLLASTLSTQEWYLVYKSFVSELAMHLMEADKDLNPTAYKEVEKLITSKRRLTTATHDCMGQQVTQEKLEAKAVIHMEPQRQFGAPAVSMWAKVAAAANFTPEQRQVILGIRRKFLEQLQGIIQQRRAIIAELQDSVPDFKSGANGHATITKAFQASHHLCESIVQEHAIVWAFLKEVCHESMSPIQEARVMVASFPFFPDTPAICNAIAHENAHGHDAGTPDNPASAASNGSPGLGPSGNSKGDAAMSTIFNSLRSDTLPGQGQPAGSLRTAADSNASAKYGLASASTTAASNTACSTVGEPQLPDTSFGFGDMWAAQQPLLLDSAWVAALPDLPLQHLGPGWGGSNDILT